MQILGEFYYQETRTRMDVTLHLEAQWTREVAVYGTVILSCYAWPAWFYPSQAILFTLEPQLHASCVLALLLLGLDRASQGRGQSVEIGHALASCLLAVKIKGLSYRQDSKKS